jgi:hypothetical protein
MAHPHAKDVVGSQPQAAVSDREQQAPVQQTHLSGGLNNRGAVHVTPNMDHIPTHHDRKADDAPATATSVPRPSEKRVLNQSITTPHDRKAEEIPATKTQVARPSSKRRPLDQSTTRPGHNRHLRGLPQDWCDWCLASHPFKDENRSYHIRPSSENKAMHDAIASGAMPKIDPWAANMAAVQAAKATIAASKIPKPPKPARDAASMFDIDVPDEVLAIIKSRDPDRMNAYLAHQKIEDDKIKIEDDKIRAREAAEFARVVATANLPTGPASLKRRRETAVREGRQQQPGSNNIRPRKLPRAANASSATGQASDTTTASMPTYGHGSYASVAPQRAINTIEFSAQDLQSIGDGPDRAKKMTDLLRVEDDKNEGRAAANTARATATMPTYMYGSYTPAAPTAGFRSYHNLSYQNMAAPSPSAPVSNNETQGVQQPLQHATISSDASSNKDAEPSDAPTAKAGAATPT